jgi:hypothetical protein
VRSPALRSAASLYFSLPVQLALSQITRHLLIVSFWGFLFLLITGNFMGGYGGHHLMLEPEYGGTVNWVSMLQMGIALGLFTLAYQMTCYILDGYRFFFIAQLKRPFRVFALNNFIFPTAFWSTYIWLFVDFQVMQARQPTGEVLGWAASLVAGGVLVLVLAIVFFTYTDANLKITERLGQRLHMGIDRPVRVVRRALVAMEQPVRVDIYFSGYLSFGLRRAPARIRGDYRPMMQVLTRNHGNALIVLAFFAFLLGMLSLLRDQPAYQLPSGVSLLLWLALLLMFVGAINYWLRRVGLLAVFALAGLFVFLNNFEPFVGRHSAIGLDYTGAKVRYSPGMLARLAKPEYAERDLDSSYRMLDRWLVRYRAQHGPKAKPTVLLVATSGGGLRSAVWTLTALQAADSVLGGRLGEHLRVVTGASGGMIGASYWRELMLDSAQDYRARQHPEHARRLSGDLLNPITFAMLANVFTPARQLEESGDHFDADRGYVMEKWLIANTGRFADRRLDDYRLPERQGRIPQIIYSPAILNDGRQLLVASQPVSYLMKAMRFNDVYRNEIPSVDYQGLFKDHQPGRLRITTAIRMSASFPYVLPFIELPTAPTLQVMDAGAIDNYGVYVATQWIFAHKAWLEANARGVVLLQLRDSRSGDGFVTTDPNSISSRLLGAVGSAAHAFARSKDFQNDYLIAYTRTSLNVPFQALELQYIPQKSSQEASLSFHLTDFERQDVISAMDQCENRQTLNLLGQLFDQGERMPPMPSGCYPTPTLPGDWPR